MKLITDSIDAPQLRHNLYALSLNYAWRYADIKLFWSVAYAACPQNTFIVFGVLIYI